MTNEILVRNGYAPALKLTKLVTNPRKLGTVISNLVYYGFVPNKDLNHALLCCGDAALEKWYSDLEPVLKRVTGADKKMEKFVVYKNFPKEVLDMSQGEYWFRQIFIYLGVPQHFVAQPENERPFAFENLPLKVLGMADAKTPELILQQLFDMNNRWTPEQLKWAKHLIDSEGLRLDIGEIPFKENLVNILDFYNREKLEFGNNVVISPTDVLRFAVVLSGGEADLKKKFRFINFKRKERRFISKMLEVHGWEKLAENFASKKELWKRLLERLHAKDFGCLEVDAAYNLLYNKECHSAASWTEYYIQNKDVAVFKHIRVGDFMRRLKHLYAVFGNTAFVEFGKKLDDLTNIQLLKIRRQLDWHNYQNTRIFAPKGNWGKAKVFSSDQQINQEHIDRLLAKIDQKLADRLKNIGPVKLDPNADFVKIQTNDSDMLPYGRGTVFSIPENITFLRSCSYWQSSALAWMDNGWNFFDENWKSVSTCCWNSPHSGGGRWFDKKSSYAVFSGDPVNTGEMKGRAGQMIDIYIDNMLAAGVRYGVWNILSYCGQKFDDITDIHAALQWGENPMANKLFEPSRAIINAPIKGDSKSKYILILDAKERKIIYADANLKANVRSALLNGVKLETVMPAYMEYLDRQPSVADLFANAPQANRHKNFVYVGYDDKNIDLNGQTAYVFRPQNENNSYTPLNIDKILGEK